jgi:hypothetical protein
MLRTLLELAIAPALAAGSTLACRRWGSRTGGLLSAFPAVVGPVLLITAQQRGALFAARAANGTLLGLVALSGFILCYGRVAPHARWPMALTAAWASAALLGVLAALAGGRLGLLAALSAATVSLSAAHQALPPAPEDLVTDRRAASPRHDIALRMALTALLIVLLMVASELLGPWIGGVLAGLPVLASVLAVFTHRSQGSAPVIALLRGMVSGMAGFVGFCAVVALLIVPAGVAPAFAAAVLTAVSVQFLALDGGARLRQGSPRP